MMVGDGLTLEKLDRRSAAQAGFCKTIVIILDLNNLWWRPSSSTASWPCYLGEEILEKYWDRVTCHAPGPPESLQWSTCIELLWFQWVVMMCTDVAADAVWLPFNVNQPNFHMCPGSGHKSLTKNLINYSLAWAGGDILIKNASRALYIFGFF